MNNVKYFYIRQPNVNTEKFGHRGDPIACVAYTVDKIDDGTDHDLPYSEVRYALATRNPKPDEEGNVDQFCKHSARTISTLRLSTSNLTDDPVSVFTFSEKVSDITADIMFDLYTDSLTPSRVKKAAKKWLWPDGFQEIDEMREALCSTHVSSIRTTTPVSLASLDTLREEVRLREEAIASTEDALNRV